MNIRLDTIALNHESLVADGTLFYKNEHIYYFDYFERTVSIFSFDVSTKSAAFKTQWQPLRMPRFITYGRANGNAHWIVSDFTLTEYDSSWVFQKQLAIDWDDDTPIRVLKENPDRMAKGIYEFDWGKIDQYLNQILIESDSTALLPVTTEHPLFNGFMHSEYYQEAAVLARVSLHTGKVIDLIGRRSKIYQELEFIPNFDFFSFTQKQDNIIINFAADSLIYVWDHNGQPISTFGSGAKNMQTNYPQTTTFDDAAAAYWTDLRTYGHYGSLYYNQRVDLTFRNYYPGNNVENQHMQVYKGNNLIGDFAVPKRFKIIGCFEGYCLADGIVDEQSNTLSLFAFELITCDGQVNLIASSKPQATPKRSE